MTLLIVYGIFLIAIGALMSGSFAIPFDHVKGWKWENYWLAYCLFGYIVVPLACCLVFTPDFVSALGNVSGSTLGIVLFWGIIYGASNLTFGLSLRYLGLALGFALSLGLMMVIGTLLPPAIDGRLSKLFEGNGGIILIAGIATGIIGICISGYAGLLKSRETESSQSGNSEFDLKKGLAAALFVGITGSACAMGIEQGTPIADAALDSGADPLFATCPVFLTIYSGAFITTLIWCLILTNKNKSLSLFVKNQIDESGKRPSILKNFLFCAMAGFLWFINYVFFGMGKAQMGDYSFVAWGILMTLTIVFATLWGLYRKEWQGVSRRCYVLMWTGLIILLAASFLIGMSSGG
jgi:L-rhamnose-H+ transport protein